MVTCNCAAESTPHQWGSGQCRGGYKLVDTPFVCSCCGAPVRGKVIDLGIGPYEFWGATGVHHEYTVSSECCEEAVWRTPDSSDDDEVTYEEWKNTIKALEV